MVQLALGEPPLHKSTNQTPITAVSTPQPTPLTTEPKPAQLAASTAYATPQSWVLLTEKEFQKQNEEFDSFWKSQPHVGSVNASQFEPGGSQLSILKKLWSEAELILLCSLQQAQQSLLKEYINKNKKIWWPQTSFSSYKLWSYLGITMVITLQDKSDEEIENYWKITTSNLVTHQWIQSQMSIKEWKLWHKCLKRCNGKEDELANALVKIILKVITPGSILTADESMAKHCARHQLDRVCVPNKPDPNGYKWFVIGCDLCRNGIDHTVAQPACESESFASQEEQRRVSVPLAFFMSHPSRGSMKMHMVIKKLIDMVCQAHPGHQFLTIFDSGFTSKILAELLSDSGQLFIGKSVSNRLKDAFAFLEHCPDNQAETLATLDEQSNPIFATVSKVLPKRQPNVATENMTPKFKVGHFISNCATAIPLNAESKFPQVAGLYNLFMGLIDFLDKQKKELSNNRRNSSAFEAKLKWLLSMSLITAWGIWVILHSEDLTVQNYTDQVIEQIGEQGIEHSLMSNYPKRSPCHLCKHKTSSMCTVCDWYLCSECALKNAGHYHNAHSEEWIAKVKAQQEIVKTHLQILQLKKRLDEVDVALQNNPQDQGLQATKQVLDKQIVENWEKQNQATKVLKTPPESLPAHPLLDLRKVPTVSNIIAFPPPTVLLQSSSSSSQKGMMEQ